MRRFSRYVPTLKIRLGNRTSGIAEWKLFKRISSVCCKGMDLRGAMFTWRCNVRSLSFHDISINFSCLSFPFSAVDCRWGFNVINLTCILPAYSENEEVQNASLWWAASLSVCPNEYPVTFRYCLYRFPSTVSTSSQRICWKDWAAYRCPTKWTKANPGCERASKRASVLHKGSATYFQAVSKLCCCCCCKLINIQVWCFVVVELDLHASWWCQIPFVPDWI